MIAVPSFWAFLVVFGLLVYFVWQKCLKLRSTNNHKQTTKAETEVAVVNSADEPGSKESGFKKFQASVPSKSSAKVKIAPENNQTSTVMVGEP